MARAWQRDGYPKREAVAMRMFGMMMLGKWRFSSCRCWNMGRARATMETSRTELRMSPAPGGGWSSADKSWM